MEILRTSKKFWRLLSGVYLSSNGSSIDFVLSALLNAYHIAVSLIMAYSNVGALYFDGDKMDASHTMLNAFQLFTNIALLINYLLCCGRKFVAAKLATEFQRIVDERISALNVRIYEKAEQKVEFYTKWPLTTYCVVYHGGLVIATLLYLVYSTLQGDIDVYKWPSLFQLRFVRLETLMEKIDSQITNSFSSGMPYLPYAKDDLVTHFLHCIAQMVCITTYLVLHSSALSTFYAFHAYIDAFCKDFRLVFDSIDEQLASNRHSKVNKLLLDAYKLETVIVKCEDCSAEATQC